MKSYQKHFVLLLLALLPFAVMLAQTKAQPCEIEATLNGQALAPGSPSSFGTNGSATIRIVPNPDFEGVSLISAKLNILASNGGLGTSTVASLPFEKKEDGSLEIKISAIQGNTQSTVSYVIEEIKVRQGRKVGQAKFPLSARTFLLSI